MDEQDFLIEWEGQESNDDGKQSDFVTGTAHSGCCKQ